MAGMVKQADVSRIEEIVALDEAVMGTRCREPLLRQAVGDGECYVVLNENAVMGFGILDYSFYENGFIKLLIVGSGWRRRGFGRLLVETFKELCRTEKLFTSTNSSNRPMQMLLADCGFERCGRIDRLDEGDPELVYCFERNRRTGKLPETKALTMFDHKFWEALDVLVAETELVIDRPKGSRHPRFPELIYPVDYGYLKGTTAMDGGGIDLWIGSREDRKVAAIICIVDLFKKDSEIKLLLGCTDAEQELIYRFHNDSEYMKGIFIPNHYLQME